MFLKSKTTKWTDRLADILRVYNSTEHSSINNYKPKEVEKHKEEVLQLNLLYKILFLILSAHVI